MTLRLLARRSLRYYFRAHLGVLAGAALAATVLIGALAVGDSVRESLKAKALERLVNNELRPDGVVSSLSTGDRFFTVKLIDALTPKRTYSSGDFVLSHSSNGIPMAANALLLAGTITRQDGAARANRINVIGVNPGEMIGQYSRWGPAPFLDFTNGQVWLNEALAERLSAKVGDEVVVRIRKPSALSRDAVISPRDETSVAIRSTVGGVVPGQYGGNLSLLANQTASLNVFVSLSTLASSAGLSGRANLILARSPYVVVDTNSLAVKVNHWMFQHEWYLNAWGRMFILRAPKIPISRVMKFFDESLARSWSLADAELSVQAVTPEPKLTGGEPVPTFAELTTRRIFLEPAVVKAALATNSAKVAQASRLPSEPAGETPALPSAVPILTYLVNTLSHGDELAPYSMVTAAGAPYTPAGLRDDEIVVNEWLAKDLGVKPGDTVALGYYRVDAGTQLVERTNSFRVHSIVPMRGLHADRSLMPEFPGLTKAESTRDWDAGFDLVHPIRDADEAYWKQWRGTPKAFITLAAGQKMWANRFGDLTAVRWIPGQAGEKGSRGAGEQGEKEVSATAIRDAVAANIRANLDPADVGLRFTDVRTPALAAAEGGTGKEFGGLMIGFSFFLITSALLLTAMLFSFSLGQRASETGILLALGWEPRRVRTLLFREGFMVATLGTALGVVGGIIYAKGVLWGLSTLWRDAVNGAGLEFHITAATLATGIGASLFVAAATLWLVLRQQAKRSARELLSDGANEAVLDGADGSSRWAKRVAVGASVAALAMVAAAWTARASNPEMFFGAGALLLVAGLLWVRVWLRSLLQAGRAAGPSSDPSAANDERRGVENNGRRAGRPSYLGLSLRGLSRRPSRSLGTAALLASAAFLIIAVGANKLDADRDATKRSSGTGGFALWAESSLPVIQDLDTSKGQEFYGLDPKKLAGVSFVPFKVRDGDDASCLNLNRAQRPRLLGVKPDQLARRGAFTFTGLAKDAGVTNGWDALRSALPAPGSTFAVVPVVPAIADANSIQWALQMQLGDTLDYVDERGQPFKVRLVGAVANSVLQGSLVIDEAEFVKRFPSESGSRAFLIDAPAGSAATVSADLTRALQDTGLEVTSAPRRLAMFNAVQNTYLDTFQMLGGLGLLLGSVGLGVVVLRNVFERRGELAVMQAVGFERSALQRFVLVEHGALLVLGLGVGMLAAVVAVLPALTSPGAQVPWASLAVTLLAVLLNGGLWTWLATRRALGGSLVGSLRAL